MNKSEALEILKTARVADTIQPRFQKAYKMAIKAFELICDGDCEHCTYTECPLEEEDGE